MLVIITLIPSTESAHPPFETPIKIDDDNDDDADDCVPLSRRLSHAAKRRKPSVTVSDDEEGQLDHKTMLESTAPSP